MPNRSLVLLLLLAFAILPSVAEAGAPAPGQARTPAAAPATGLARPVCGLEGEIGEGRGRIVARGAAGYRGEMSIPLTATPLVVLKVASDFTPHRPAVDRITLQIGSDAASDTPDAARLSGTFGQREGRSFAVTRSNPPVEQDTAWFDALMAGQTLTAAEGEVSASIAYPADRFEDDYNYLLDLLQLVAGWEIAELCVNRPNS